MNLVMIFVPPRLPTPRIGRNSQAVEHQALFELKESKVNEALESLRVKKEIGQSLDAEVEIQLSQNSPISSVLDRFSPSNYRTIHCILCNSF